MNTDICGNCNFFNEHKKMVNGSYICNYHGLTTNPTNMGCYKIQKTKICQKEFIIFALGFLFGKYTDKIIEFGKKLYNKYIVKE